MKNIRKPIAFLTVLCILPWLLVSCGGRYTEDDIAPALAELIPASYALNEIYFGAGLPISDNREDVEAFYAAMDTDITSVNYHPVAEDCGYANIDEIKDATLAVFTEDYCSYLFTMAFTGLSAVFNEDTEQQLTQTVSYARYLETSGVLTVRMDLPYEAMPLLRTYDTSDFEIVQQGENYVVAAVQSYIDGEKDIPVKLKLVLNAENQWRLDSPTY